MQELAGKTAFVTGGASGIGFALGRAFAEAGMCVMLADIEADALTAAADELRQLAPHVRSVVCDVAQPDSVERAAQAAFDAFGNVHIVCNNAGVGGGSGIDDISLDTWRWVLDVNLMGVLHGIRSFLPHIRGHGEGGHIVNTASMAGMVSGLGFSPYATSKFAVVGMSKGWRRSSSRLASASPSSARASCARASPIAGAIAPITMAPCGHRHLGAGRRNSRHISRRRRSQASILPMLRRR